MDVKYLTLVLQRGVATTPNSFALVLKKHSQWVKLLRVPLSSSFPLTLAKKKKNEPTTFPRVGQALKVRGEVNPVILKLDYFEYIWSDMHSKLCLQLTIVIF